jgi:hypothetical protein
MSGKDLGTFHLRIEFKDGRGYIQRWDTGARYTHGCRNVTRLDAQRIESVHDDVDDLLDTMLYMYTEGNYSCDCNKMIFWRRSQQLPDQDDETGAKRCQLLGVIGDEQGSRFLYEECGDKIELGKLTAIFPNGEEKVLLEQTGDSK